MRILLAEDNPASRMLLESYLKKWGYNVVTCVNGKEALEILGQEDAPEIAILDWLMPDIDGIEVCRTVRTSKQTLLPYLIFVTAKSSEQDLAEGLQQGADDYLVKPVGELELRARIQVGLRVVSMWKRLIEAERNRVLMETAGAAAHEINNPLAVMLGRIELALTKKDIDTETKKDLSEIHNAGMRISKVVKDMELAWQYSTKPYIKGTDIIDFDSAANP